MAQDKLPENKRNGMAAGYQSTTMRISGWADGLARFDALLLIIAVLSHRFGWLETINFFWVLALGLSIALISLLLGMFSLRRAWVTGESGSALAFRAFVLCLLILVPYGYAGWRLYEFPALNDISTDLLDPPEFSTLASQRDDKMNRIDPITQAEATRQSFAYPEVTGRRYGAAPDTVSETILAIIKANGWSVAGQIQAPGSTGETTFELAVRSTLLGLGSDVAIRVTDEGETTFVDMRSASRFGTHDLGLNAARIVSFLKTLDLEMAGKAGG